MRPVTKSRHAFEIKDLWIAGIWAAEKSLKMKMSWGEEFERRRECFEGQKN
jgi:hypothetical protein